MAFHPIVKATTLLALVASVSACGNRTATTSYTAASDAPIGGAEYGEATAGFNYEKSSIWDVLGGKQAEQTVQVNRYIWAASLDVLNFLPIQSVDPFTGVIVTGYGTPPGGGRSYRATVHISDPALDARSLNVALHSKGGAVNASTARAVEDAILTRARQLRTRDKNL